eukprot:5203733-Prymnesium_polylepis.1
MCRCGGARTAGRAAARRMATRSECRGARIDRKSRSLRPASFARGSGGAPPRQLSLGAPS